MDKNLLSALRIFKECVNKRHLSEIREKKENTTKIETMKFNSRLLMLSSRMNMSQNVRKLPFYQNKKSTF